jgi:hypothetical protein
MLNNSLKWVTNLAKQIKGDLSTFVSRMTQIFNIVYVDKYYAYNCKRCGRDCNVELCKTCDY